MATLDTDSGFLTDTPTPPATTTSTSTPLSSSSSSSLSPLSNILSSPSSLFPGLQAADLFLANDNDDDIIYDGDMSVFETGFPLSTISPFPCVSSNTSSSFSSGSLSPHRNISCPDDALSKMKVYSSDDLWAENEMYARNLAPAMVYIALLMFIGIFGNILVVYVYGFRFKSATQHFLIVCLACFDLIMCLVAMPTEITDMRFHHTFSSLFACKLLRFVTMFASMSSSLTLVTVAYDRHRRITRPLGRQITMKQARIWTLVNMLCALCFSWPTLVLTGIRTSQTRIPGLKGTDCSFSEEYRKTKFPLVYNAVLGLGFFTLVTVIAVFYFRIWKTAKTRKINMAKRYTIGSLSDQSLNELKLQKKMNKDGMNEILTKQLEKYARDKLKAKASIDCKDICYFFENNSLKAAVSSSIARKRGRYREFSVSSLDDESSSKSPRNSNSGDSILGHSFSYRTSITSRIRDQQVEENNSRKLSNGRRSKKLSNGVMEKIPEDSFHQNEQPKVCARTEVSNSPISTASTSDSSHLHGDIHLNDDLYASQDKYENQIGMENSENKLSDKSGLKSNLEQYLPTTTNHVLTSSSRKAVTDLEKTTASPSLSIKSNSSTLSLSYSPGRYRRNSSPVIRPKIKDNLKNAISIISDDLHFRPMSSLVDSVSQSLARFQEFSDFDISVAEIENFIHDPRSLKSNENNTEDQKHVPLLDSNLVTEYSTLETNGKAKMKNSVSCTDIRNISDKDNTKDETDSAMNINPKRSQNIFCTSNDTVTRSSSFTYGQNTAMNKNIISDSSGIVCLDNETSLDYPDMSLIRSFSHLIGPRIKPMEIRHLCHKDVEDRNGICNNFSAMCNVDISLCDDISYENENSTCERNPKTCKYFEIDSESNLNSNGCRYDKLDNNRLSIDSSYRNGTCKSAVVRSRSGEVPNDTSPTPSQSQTSINETSENRKSSDVSVQVRCKLRSYSNSSLDALSTTTTRRRGKVKCLCLSQNLDKTTVVAFTVSSVFVLSFLPFLILMIIRGIVKDFDYDLRGASLCVYHIFLRFYFLNSAINPFLYGLLNVNFRYECVRTWKKLFRCHDNNKSRENQDTIIVC